MQCHCTLKRSLAQRDRGRPPNAAAYAINPLPFVSFLLIFWAGFKASRQPAQQCTSICRDVGNADERNPKPSLLTTAFGPVIHASRSENSVHCVH